jgi:hypothetical protein
MTNWAKMTGFAAMLAVALAGSLHWSLYYPNQVELSGRDSNSPTFSSKAAGAQSSDQTKGDWVSEAFTGILAVATLALMFATTGLVFLSQRQIKDARVIQRAYVKVSSGARNTV